MAVTLRERIAERMKETGFFTDKGIETALGCVEFEIDLLICVPRVPLEIGPFSPLPHPGQYDGREREYPDHYRLVHRKAAENELRLDGLESRVTQLGERQYRNTNELLRRILRLEEKQCS